MGVTTPEKSQSARLSAWKLVGCTGPVL